MIQPQFPRLAMLAYTPHDTPDAYVVVRPFTDELDLAQVAAAAAAEAAGEPEEATRLLTLARADARNRCTRFLLEPDPDSGPPEYFGSVRAFREEPEERVLLERAPLALVQAMGPHGTGTLQVWAETVMTAETCPGMQPLWITVLLPRIELRAWEYHRHAQRQQFDIEAHLRSHIVQHTPYGPLPEHVAGVRCKRLTYTADTLPQPTA
jgi:hypothetical protein